MVALKRLPAHNLAGVHYPGPELSEGTFTRLMFQQCEMLLLPAGKLVAGFNLLTRSKRQEAA